MADYNSTFTGPQIDAALSDAQTATQPSDLADVATSGQYSDLAGSPTLGSASAQDFTDNDDLSIDPGNVPTRGNVSAAIAAGGGSRGVMHVRDEKPAGTQGGSSIADTTIVRDLNSVVTNTISGASLSSNTITLPEGMYIVHASSQANQVDGHKSHIYSVTDAAIALQGSNSFDGVAETAQSGIAQVAGILTVPTGGGDYTLRHYFRNTRAIVGMGLRVPNSGFEVYSNVLIIEV